MKEVDQSFLVGSAKLIEDRAGLLGSFTVDTHEEAMDKVLLTFHSKGVDNSIARVYTSTERWHFFAIRCWQSVAPFLIRLKNRFPELEGQSILWMDDVAHHPGVVFTSGTTNRQIAIPDPC